MTCLLYTSTQTADDDGGGTGLRLGGQILRGLEGVGGVVLRGLTDEHTGDQTRQNGEVQAQMRLAQQGDHQRAGDDGDEDSGQVGTTGQGLQQGCLLYTSRCV